VRRGRADQLARSIIRDSDVRPTDPSVLARQLSGGNQQKLVVGRWTPLAPRVLLLDEPTRGVDVGARSEVHRAIDALARSGAGVVVVSSDLPELLTLSDRIVVMRDGATVGELAYDECTEEAVIRLATGHLQDEAKARGNGRSDA
jgi:ABC-type sugar transport system ATPase subunit